MKLLIWINLQYTSIGYVVSLFFYGMDRRNVAFSLSLVTAKHSIKNNLLNKTDSSMIKQTLYDPFTKMTFAEKTAIARFLQKNQENSTIDIPQIQSALDAAVKEIPSFGGFVLTVQDEDNILATVVVNHTGMDGFGPAHILTHFATHKEHRNVGIGRKLLTNAIAKLKGSVSLHLENNHPEKALLLELGFTEKYVEMELDRRKTRIA